MKRFLPHFNQSARAINKEFEATIGAAEACGFYISPDIAPPTVLSGLGHIFIPDQIAPPQGLPDIGTFTKGSLKKKIQPAIVEGFKKSDERFFNLAHQVGRLTAAGAAENRIFVPLRELSISDKSVSTDGHSVDYEADKVIEFGMGIAGVFSHIQNAKNGHYSVLGVHRSRSEVAVLGGIADFYGLNQSQMETTERGIPQVVNELTAGEERETAGLVIASRVHGAGRDLQIGVAYVSGLLQSGGLLVARGPKRVMKDNIGYNQLLSKVRRDRNMEIVVNHDFLWKAPHAGSYIEPSRLIIARRV
jgi:hypothetical protein